MDLVGITLKVLAILYSLGGIFLLSFTTDEEFQRVCIYEGRNPIVGDVLKYLANGSGLSLAVCGFAVFYLPVAAVVLVWLSLILHLLTGLVDSVARRAWPGFCVACSVNIVIRATAAVALTLLYHHWTRA